MASTILNRAVLWNALFASVRLLLLTRFLFADTWVLVIFGLSELSAVIFTFLAARGTVVLESLPSARIVPVLYMLPLCLMPHGYEVPHSKALLLGSMLLQIGLRCYMRSAVTVGLPNYQRIITSGPYSLLRHPLAACEMMIVTLFTLSYFNLWNVVVTVVAITSFAIAARYEERFLLRFPPYVRYSDRVRWRFLPLS